MSRLANMPITLPKGVSVTTENNQVTVKGKKTLVFPLDPHIVLSEEAGLLHIKLNSESDVLKQHKKNRRTKVIKNLNTLSGTARSLLNKAVIGVSEGFKLKLELVGVGYRAQVQGNKLNLTLGFSHPVVYELPKEVTAETPSQTEIMLSSHDCQLLGQVAAEIRTYRPPECYKGKGIKYAGEKIILKETKKK